MSKHNALVFFSICQRGMCDSAYAKYLEMNDHCINRFILEAHLTVCVSFVYKYTTSTIDILKREGS